MSIPEGHEFRTPSWSNQDSCEQWKKGPNSRLGYKGDDTSITQLYGDYKQAIIIRIPIFHSQYNGK